MATYDLALRLYAMANNMSTSGSTGAGTGIKQLVSYLQFSYDAYQNAIDTYKNDAAKANKLYNDTMRSSKWASVSNLSVFLAGNIYSEKEYKEVPTKAYSIYIEAMKKKHDVDKGATTNIRDNTNEIVVNPEVTCDGTNIYIQVQTQETVKNTQFILKDNSTVSYNKTSKTITIPKSKLFNVSDGSSLMEGTSVLSLTAKYQGGTSGNILSCSVIKASDEKNQTVIAYTGETGKKSGTGSFLTKNININIPNECIPMEYIHEYQKGMSTYCTSGGTRVFVDTDNLHNCCNDGTDSTETTVKDAPDKMENIFEYNNSLKVNDAALPIEPFLFFKIFDTADKKF